jgi:plastocyanin
MRYNKIKTIVAIAGILGAVAAISLIYDLDRKAEGQTMPPPAATNANTQVQVGGGNATYPFFGYNPQTVEINVGSKVVWNALPQGIAEPHTITFVFNDKTMTSTDTPFAVSNSTKFIPLPPGSNSEPNMIPGKNAMNTVIVNNGRSYNPTVINSTGGVKTAPPNASFTITGNEQYVNSGFLVPKTAEKVYPGSSDTFTITFQKGGTYYYLCILHPWMTGTVIVK